MNQELKQRLIGAVVVTALAAIFIPMLFDDPVDNSGQLVSELVIPATPVNTGEESANKLPTSADQVLNTPAAGSETVVNTEEEAELSANQQPPSDEPIDDESQIDTEAGVEQAVDEPDQPIDEPENDSSPASLDTGVINETKKPIKTKKTIQEAESSKQKSTPKLPLEADAAVGMLKKPVKKSETSTTKQPAKVKPLTTATIVNKTEKSVVKQAKSSSELSRWYLQAGSFSKKENAMSLMETLRKQGLPVTLEATKGTGNAPLYRLKVGPALEKKRAADMKAKLDSQKIQSILIAE
jgi:DedD protein